MKVNKGMYFKGIPLLVYEECYRKALGNYVRELLHFNNEINLFSRKQDESFCWKMVLDSILASRLLLKQGVFSVITDIGSGAGFPGIILAILYPSQRVDLFESHQKKAQFLEYLSWKMGLSKVKVYPIPVQKSEKTIECGVSKAFLSLQKRMSLTDFLFKKGSVYFHLQSLKWEEEWGSVSEEIRNNWEPCAHKYQLEPFLKQRVLLKTVKRI